MPAVQQPISPVRYPQCIDVSRSSAPPPAASLRRVAGRPRPPGGRQSLLQLVVEQQQPAGRTRESPDRTGHLFGLLFFFLFSFVLRSKLAFFLLFLLAFISSSLITHIDVSLLEPTFRKRHALSNVTEPPHGYCTRPGLPGPGEPDQRKREPGRRVCRRTSSSGSGALRASHVRLIGR